ARDAVRTSPGSRRRELVLRLGLVQRARKLAAVLGDEPRLAGRDIEQRKQPQARFTLTPVLIAPHDLEQLVHCVAIPALRGVSLRELEARGMIVAIRIDTRAQC